MLSKLSSIFLLTLTQLNADSLKSAGDLFQVRCSQCHGIAEAYDVDSVLPSSWKSTVKEMQKKEDSHISDAEAEEIYEFLVSDTIKRKNGKLQQQLQALPPDQRQKEQDEIDRIKRLF